MKATLFHLAWLMAALSQLPARAQTPPPASVAQPSNPWSRCNLSGDWNGERQKLIHQGLTITPTWTQEVFGNPTGGFKQGVVESGLFGLALDADASKFTGWADGGLFHVN